MKNKIVDRLKFIILTINPVVQWERRSPAGLCPPSRDWGPGGNVGKITVGWKEPATSLECR